MEAIEFFKFEDTLNECGWAHSDFQVIKDKATGRSGFRYLLEKYSYNRPTLPFEELKRRLLEAADVPEKITFGTAYHKYAPEISKNYCIILD